MGFKHTAEAFRSRPSVGLCSEKIRAAGRPIKVLNLFGYAGAATLTCAAAGAQVCHVDASRGQVAWARENAQAGLTDRPVRWIVDDCLKFVLRAAARCLR